MEEGIGRLHLTFLTNKKNSSRVFGSKFQKRNKNLLLKIQKKLRFFTFFYHFEKVTFFAKNGQKKGIFRDFSKKSKK